MEKTKDKRLGAIDTLRGITIVSMIIYHFCWDMVFIFDMKWKWFHGMEALIWERLICISFIFISGFCLVYSKNPIKRGVLLFLLGGLITTITYLVMPKNLIVFGILTLIGSCLIFVGLCKKWLMKIPPIVGIVSFLLLFLLTVNVEQKSIVFLGRKLINLPGFLYQNYFSSYLGFPHSDFFSRDYFPIIPWIFIFLLGFFVSIQIKKEMGNGKKFSLLKKEIPLFSILGKNSLIIYMIHQPLLYGLCLLLTII
ncbi:Uncharacterized membrane protein [Acetitomaculum ruminis DSM 5522]|uniref:Uncharacterized membrane protein n=1 Tax=Acetitomaculum ruminis DSM 5522 TaxID=1120918 RepID=A0A1I1AFE8_9FIRM|nr:heparan-alpha-glucosaminide N-acetyltransferase domain-containing protein [Acetitomaculum ruminis]SFB35200.1 Uncharacterized membrane protein [Acetitomaculum ruminis DSM 5522]